MKKKLIIGTVLTVFLMLMIPNISAINTQTQENIQNLNINSIIEKFKKTDFPDYGGGGGLILLIGMILAAIYSWILHKIFY